MATPEERKPTPEQADVMNRPEGQIIVAAGAGTGKTTSTMFRFGRLLDDGVELGQILVFTFTEKAAGELADEVRKTSGHRLNPDNPEAATMSEAWVGTFHSICARILRSFPIEAGVDPGFEILDDIDSAPLKAAAARQAIALVLDEMPDAAPVVARFRMESLQDEIEDAYDELRSRGIARPRLPALPTSTYPRGLIEELKETARVTAGTEGLDHRPRKTLEGLVERLDEGFEGLTVEDLDTFRTTSKNKAVDDYRKLLAKVRATLVAYEDGDLTYMVIDRLIELFGDAYSSLKKERSVLDFEDLQIRTVELLTDPATAQVGDYYRGRFREIMVDEFQDTNGLQLRLIEALTGPETTVMTVGDEMQSIYRFRHANVELFRRRRTELAQAPEGADLTLRGNNRSDRTVIDAVNLTGRALHESATSASAGRDGSRHEFMELEQSPVSPRGDGKPGAVRLLLTERGDWGPLDLGAISPPVARPEVDEGAEEEAGGGRAETSKKKEKSREEGFHEAEALSVAWAIRDLLDSPDNDFQQRDVAILLRARKRTDNYVRALRQVGLTPYVISGRGFWDSRVAIEMRSLLGLVANPLDEEAVLASLLSPACGVSPDAPLILRQGSKDGEKLWSAAIRAAQGEGGEDGWFTQLSPEDREPLGSFVATIEAIRSTAELMPLDELVEELASRTGYDLAVLAREPESFPDVKRIASIARTYEEGNRRDLRGFLDWMEASEAVDSEASVAIEDEKSDVVRIMTVHAAKGDAFEIVAVPDLGKGFNSDTESLLMLGPSLDPEDPQTFAVGVKVDGEKAYAWDEVAEGSSHENEDEELRLFHVAMTRARSHLILSGCAPNPKKDDGDRIGATTSIATRICVLAGLPNRPDENGAWPDQPANEAWAEVMQVELNPADEATAQRLAKPGDPIAAPAAVSPGSPPLGRPEARGFPIVPLSFTALLEYATCPALFFAKRVLRLEEGGYARPDEGPQGVPLAGRDDATSFGNAVHDLLETISTRKWKMPSEGEVIRALEAEGLDPGEEGRADRALGMIQDFLASDLGSVVRSNPARAEVPLLIRFDTVTIRGFIDLLVETNIPTVIDFKTNTLKEGSRPEEKMRNGYDLQRDLYALAVAEARDIEEVETAFLFLEAADRPVTRTYAAVELTEARERIEQLVTGVIRGSYFDGDGPVPPCGSCWACEKLDLQARVSGKA